MNQKTFQQITHKTNYERREGPDFEITDVLNSSYPDNMRITIYIPVD
ncbi:effector binding domain-containing protein [Paenibacillus sp. IHBB 3054]